MVECKDTLGRTVVFYYVKLTSDCYSVLSMSISCILILLLKGVF